MKDKEGNSMNTILRLEGIQKYYSKYLYQISGGQKQRCASTRAIINNLKRLLADELAGALDSHSSQIFLSIIQSINEQFSTTIYILFLKDGEIFTELHKSNDNRELFFNKILYVLTMIEGGQSYVC